MDRVPPFSEFSDKRIAVGPPGSGTRAVALLLLEANGVSVKNAELSDASGPAAVAALNEGKLDVAFFVAAIEAHYIRDLLSDDKVQLMDLSQQAAYLQRYRFLAKVDLPAGLIDLAKNVRPRKRSRFVRPGGRCLVVRKATFHPALESLLISAAAKVHANGDWISSPGEFPSPSYTDLPLSEEAHALLQIRRQLHSCNAFCSFWLAAMIDQPQGHDRFRSWWCSCALFRVKPHRRSFAGARAARFTFGIRY